jgi:hypothetical protein
MESVHHANKQIAFHDREAYLSRIRRDRCQYLSAASALGTFFAYLITKQPIIPRMLLITTGALIISGRYFNSQHENEEWLSNNWQRRRNELLADKNPRKVSPVCSVGPVFSVGPVDPVRPVGPDNGAG